jgi:hypothetical protein
VRGFLIDQLIFHSVGKPNIEHASTDVATPSMGGGANDPAQLAVKLAAEVGSGDCSVSLKRYLAGYF